MLTFGIHWRPEGDKAGHGVSFGPMRKNMKNGVRAGSQKQGSAAQGLDLWRCGKTSHSEKSITNTLGKTPFRQTSENGGH